MAKKIRLPEAIMRMLAAGAFSVAPPPQESIPHVEIADVHQDASDNRWMNFPSIVSAAGEIVQPLIDDITPAALSQLQFREVTPSEPLAEIIYTAGSSPKPGELNGAMPHPSTGEPLTSIVISNGFRIDLFVDLAELTFKIQDLTVYFPLLSDDQNSFTSAELEPAGHIYAYARLLNAATNQPVKSPSAANFAATFTEIRHLWENVYHLAAFVSYDEVLLPPGAHTLIVAVNLAIAPGSGEAIVYYAENNFQVQVTFPGAK